MKTHQYLTNGILESYLLGLVSDSQKQDVEYVLATDSQVLAQLTELEVDMEEHFLRHAVPPPPHLRQAVLYKINGTGLQKWEYDDSFHFEQEAPQPNPTKSNYVDVEVSNTHIRVHKYWRAAFIAVFILSKVFLITGTYFYFKSNSLEQEVSRLKAEARQPKIMQPGRVN